MKIVFLCGSLEPGRDGVGDYVHRLTLELIAQGHEAAAVALNDQHIIQESPMQSNPDVQFPTLRLPACWSAMRRFNRLRLWVEDFKPSLISLQFVPYSFHPKGLPFNLGNYLALLGDGFAWHVMIHELWIGMNYEAPIKYKLLGKIQRNLIKRLLNRIKPQVIHTQTPLYQALLAKLGFESHYLPLFSNIPNIGISKSELSVLDDRTVRNGIKEIRLVVFGTIHSGAPILDLTYDVAQYMKYHPVSVILTIIGRCGNQLNYWVTAWRAAGLEVEILGEQLPSRISEVLLNSSFGIVTTPAFLITKSGTAVAMHEHSLPIICVTAPWHPEGISNFPLPQGVTLYQAGNLEACLVNRDNVIVASKVNDVALQLSHHLLSVL